MEKNTEFKFEILFFQLLPVMSEIEVVTPLHRYQNKNFICIKFGLSMRENLV